MAQNTGGSFNEERCWSRAYQCPTTTAVGGGNKSQTTTCEAWYRCDGVSNYVISWWCHGPAGTSGASSSNPSSAILQCGNSSSSRIVGRELCPPPVVCPGTVRGLDNNIKVTKDDSVDVDIILAFVLAIFAFIVLILMFVVGFKRWISSRKYNRRFHHYRPDRPYRSLTAMDRSNPYNNRWFPSWGGFPKHIRFVGKSGTIKGIPYTDVYIPSQNLRQHHIEEWTMNNHNKNDNNNNDNQQRQHHHHQQHHPNINRSNNFHGVYRTNSRSPRVKRVGKIHGDRSVVTRSFIYQPTILPRLKMRSPKFNKDSKLISNGRKSIHSPRNAQRMLTKTHTAGLQAEVKSFKNSISSPPSSHYDRHLGGFYLKGRNHENNHDVYKQSSSGRYYVSTPSPEYQSIMSSSVSSSDNSTPDFRRHPIGQVSSIRIPSLEDKNKTDIEKQSNSRFPYSLSRKYNLLIPTSTHEMGRELDLNHGYHGDIINNNSEHGDGSSDAGSWKSASSVFPYTTGRMQCKDWCGLSEAASIASKNWQYTVFSQQQQQQQQQQYKQQHQHQFTSGYHDTRHTNRVLNKGADIVRASSMKNNSNQLINNYHKHTPNSPDVIISHNVSRHHQRHRNRDSETSSSSQQQQQQHHHHHHHHRHHGNKNQIVQDFVARVTVPSYNQHRRQHEIDTADHIDAGNIIVTNLDSNYTHRAHIPGNVHDAWDSSNNNNHCKGDDKNENDGGGSNALVSQELSYDCFRNEHLRQLARQQAVASSSTLDKAVGRLSTSNIRVIPCLY